MWLKDETDDWSGKLVIFLKLVESNKFFCLLRGRIYLYFLFYSEDVFSFILCINISISDYLFIIKKEKQLRMKFWRNMEMNKLSQRCYYRIKWEYFFEITNFLKRRQRKMNKINKLKTSCIYFKRWITINFECFFFIDQLACSSSLPLKELT